MDTILLYIPMLLFLLFGAFAIGCAVSVVAQRNPLYSAVSLIGVFLSFAGLYILLAAPFIAAVQIIVYAGAIMVLVVFVIMLLNIEEEEHRPVHLRILIPTAVVLAMLLIGEATFIFYFIGDTGTRAPNSSVGLTASIGAALFTKYLLPFEITSILLLMALVGAITLARRVGETTANPEDVDAGESDRSNVVNIADASVAHSGD